MFVNKMCVLVLKVCVLVLMILMMYSLKEMAQFFSVGFNSVI